MSEALDAPAFSGPGIVLAAPTRDSDGRLTGVLAGALRLDWLGSVADAIADGPAGEILVVDRAGKLIAARGLAAPVDVSASPLVREGPASGKRFAQGWFEDVTGLRGSPDRLVGWGWNAQAGWTVLVDRPSITGAAQRDLALRLAEIALLLGLAALAILVLGRRFDRLAAEQRRARELAEVRQRRAERLGRLADRLSVAVESADVEDAALELGLEALGADSAVILLQTGDDVVLRDARGRPGEATRSYRLDERLPGIRALHTRQPVWVETLAEHGYGDGAEGDVVVEASRRADEIRISVRDRGTWTEGATSTERGRGLLLVRGLSDDLVVEREPTGTTVTFRRTVAAGSAARRR